MTRLSYFFSVLVLFLTFFSCSSQPQENTQTIKTPEPETSIIDKRQDSIDFAIEELAKTIITNRNAVERLTEFGDSNRESKVVIYTNYGQLAIKLYRNTPLHRANFLLLAKKKFYDNTLFYRVIDNFMIQGGNSDDSEINQKLDRIGRYRIPNEINNNNIHKRGAIAMAVSPEEQSLGKKSSSINFYIIEGQKLPSYYFKQKEEQGKKFSALQKKIYSKSKGAPHLDGDYTVFGEMISGFQVLSKISKVKVDKYNWPINKVVIDSVRTY